MSDLNGSTSSKPPWRKEEVKLIHIPRTHRLEKFHNLYFSQNIIIMMKSRKMRWEGQAARIGLRVKCIGIWLKARSKETSGRPKHRWEDNVKIDLREILSVSMDWIFLAQDRNHWRAL
jgi:hypothetical protein